MGSRLIDINGISYSKTFLTTRSKILKLAISILVLKTMDLSNTFNYLYMSNGDALHDTQLLNFCEKIREKKKVLS